MNIRALRLPILFTGFILSVLVSLSAFSLSANAEVCTTFNTSIATATKSGYYNVTFHSSDNSSFVGFCLFKRDDNSYFLTPIFTSNFTGANLVYSANDRNRNTWNVRNTYVRSYLYNNQVYYYYANYSVINKSDYSINYAYTYDSIASMMADVDSIVNPPPSGPEFADFGFNNIQYTPYINPTGSLLFDSYRFENLSYLISWQGSTDSEFPITSYNYELYGFSDSAMSNADKSNGELVDSGSHTVPNVFAYEVPYGSLTDLFGGMKYDKVVLYLTPFSDVTEGNTFYIVLNIVRNDGFSVSLGPFDINASGSVKDIVYGDGVLPVPQTDVVQIDDNQYYPVGYIDQTPIVYAIKTTSGTYNNHYDIYRENISYAPVVYGDTEYITNNDNSKVTNNNQSYNVIINNINGSIDIDPDSSGAADSIVSFLSMIVIFFQTCWTYFFQGFLFFPEWVNILIVQLFNLLGSIVVALGIIKILRGIF